MIGRYEVKRALGQGGFGRVYLAYDCDLDRLVAIKVPIAARGVVFVEHRGLSERGSHARQAFPPQYRARL